MHLVPIILIERTLQYTQKSKFWLKETSTVCKNIMQVIDVQLHITFMQVNYIYALPIPKTCLLPGLCETCFWPFSFLFAQKTGVFEVPRIPSVPRQ